MALVLDAVYNAAATPVNVVSRGANNFVEWSVNVFEGSFGETEHSLVLGVSEVGELVVGSNVGVLFSVNLVDGSCGLCELSSAEVEFFNSSVRLSVLGDEVHEFVVVFGERHG